MKFFSNGLLTAVALLTFGMSQEICYAGTFLWGDINGTNVSFLDVTENNNEGTSLFAPEPGIGGPAAVGDTLHFVPQGFGSQSQGNSADLIDSMLSTTIMAMPGSGITDLSITELGDFSLGGLIGGQASAEVGAAFFWTVLEINNSPVSLGTQATNLIVDTGSGPNGGIYSRPSDDGTATIWSGVANIDLAGFLDSLAIDGTVTKLQLTFDNTLQTAADDVSTAFIQKKAIDISVNVVEVDPTVVPEPTSMLLLGFGLAVASVSRRRV